MIFAPDTNTSMHVLWKRVIRENENKKSWSTIIDEKVELWYEKFKDDIDIGRISSFNVLGTSFEVDVLPDTMEKAIYKKCIKIIFAMILEMKDNI